jgi:hypothetical protein
MVLPVGIISDGMTCRYGFINNIFFRQASIFGTQQLSDVDGLPPYGGNPTTSDS